MSRRTRSRRAADEASILVAAPPDRLYDLVSDIAGMGRLSDECTGGRWLRGADGPAVGAVFKGTNRRGPVRWSTRNRVVAANRGREFAFETEQSGTRWRYLFEPQGEATLVTEQREPWRRRPLTARVFTMLLLGGVKDHDEEMRSGLASSLERLKSAAEAPDPPTGRRGRRGRVRR